MNHKTVNKVGLSLVELIMTLTILSILAALILPSAQMISKRNKEIELRRSLRIIRNAIDDFYKTNEKGIAENKIPSVLNKSSYPETLDQLIDGSDHSGYLKEKKKYLRRVPLDPFADKQSAKTPEWGWGLRSSTDRPDSTSWGREDVYDVYSQSEETAIDGTKYKDW